MTWEKKRVLVTVKAYPEISTKHGQVVCTAGITDEGEWIRLYPMPYTLFVGIDKIQRYDRIEVECQKATDEKLGRKESHKVRDGSVRIVDRTLSQGKVNGHAPWARRSAIILPKLASSIDHLEEQYSDDKTSLGLIKPTAVREFYARKELQQPSEVKEYQRSLDNQLIPIIDVIPHDFAYNFLCAGCQDGKYHDIICEDWELFEAYRSWWKRYPNVTLLWKKLHQRFFDYMISQDLCFYMGMYSQMPSWLIIGLYYPPKDILIPVKKPVTLGNWMGT